MSDPIIPCYSNQGECLPPASLPAAPTSLTVNLYNDVLTTVLTHLSLEDRAVALPTCQIFRHCGKEATRREIRQKHSFTWKELETYAVALNDNNHELDDGVGSDRTTWIQRDNKLANQIAGVGRCWSEKIELDLRDIDMANHCALSFKSFDQIHPDKRALVHALKFPGRCDEEDMIKLLTLFPNATSLDFGGNELKKNVIVYLPHALERLVVRESAALSDVELNVLAQKCRTATHLNILGLKGQNLSPIADACCALTHLCLEDCPEDILIKFFGKSPNLAHLAVSGKGVTDNAIGELAKNCRKLEAVILIGSPVKDMNALAHCDLHTLYLLEECPNITDEGLACGIQNWTHLRHVKFEKTPGISKVTIDNLATYSKKLQSFSMSEEEEGREAINRLAASCPELCFIELEGLTLTEVFPHLIPKDQDEVNLMIFVPYWLER